MATLNTGRTYFAIQNRIDDIICKGLEHEYQTFVAKARSGHIVTESYLHKIKVSVSPL